MNWTRCSDSRRRRGRKQQGRNDAESSQVRTLLLAETTNSFLLFSALYVLLRVGLILAM